MEIDTYKIAKIINEITIASPFAINGVPDLRVYDVKVVGSNAPLDAEPYDKQLSHFVGTPPFKPGDILNDYTHNDHKQLKAIIEEVKAVDDTDVDDYESASFSIKTNLFNEQVIAHLDSEQNSVPTIGQEITINLSTFDGSVRAYIEEFQPTRFIIE